MKALHVRNVPESVVISLRERAARHGHSMQHELRLVLEAAAKEPVPSEVREPVRLVTVPAGAATSTWSRGEMYDDSGR